MKIEPLIFKDLHKGIAASPHVGIADMRNVNIETPGEVSINLNTSALTTPPTVTTLAYTTDTTANTLTVASTSGWYNGMAITLDTVVTSTGISTGRVYWIGDLTATTVKLYKNPSLAVASLVDITGSNGSGTLSSYTFAAPLDKATFHFGTGALIRSYSFILDTNGRVWWIANSGGSLTTNLIYMGNDTLTGTTGRAIAVYKQHIVVFRTSTTDYLNVGRIEDGTDLDSASGWVYSWEGVSDVPQTRRPVIVAQDDILYYGNDYRIGAIIEVAGQTFDPTSGATYDNTASVLDLPDSDDVESLGELGTYLLVGTTRKYVYPWDRTSESFELPITLPENKTVRIVNANNLAYLFAGNTGNIYVTNGSSVGLFFQVPDYPAGVTKPYYTWGDALTWRNDLYFSFTATTNASGTLTSTGAVWAIDTATKAFRCTHKLSYGSYAGSVPVIMPHVLAASPPGDGLYIGWTTGSTHGVDITASTYYTSYASYLETDLRETGTALIKRTFSQIHVQLGTSLASGEGVRISYRKNLTDAYTTLATFDFATYGAVSSMSVDAPITDSTFLQIKAELTSSGSTSPKLRTIYLT